MRLVVIYKVYLKYGSHPQILTTHSLGFRLGGDEGNRTLDPLLAGQVLSQLSYTPILMGFLFIRSFKIEQQTDT